MSKRSLIIRCAIAGAGALFCFTTAIATPATRIEVSVLSGKTGAGRLTLSHGDAGYDDLGMSGRDGRCWRNAAVRACVSRASLR